MPPPAPLLEEEVVAAEGNANSRPRGHVETTCTRRRVQTCLAQADDGACDGRQRHILHGSHPGRRRKEIAALQSLLRYMRRAALAFSVRADPLRFGIDTNCHGTRPEATMTIHTCVSHERDIDWRSSQRCKAGLTGRGQPRLAAEPCSLATTIAGTAAMSAF